MKQFKEGDDAYIKCKIFSIHEEDKFPITVEFSTNIDVTFKANGKYIDKDTIPCLFHLSDIQQSQFTDEELEIINDDVKEIMLTHEIPYEGSKRGELINKINNLIQSPEEKQLLELANKLGYKIEKI